MTKSKDNDITLTTKPAFQAIGLHWEGTFAQAHAGEIRELQVQLKNRLDEIPRKTYPDQLLGLSYPDGEERLTHYALVEVEQVDIIPEGMVTIALPELDYVTYSHASEADISESYARVFAWMKEKGLRQPDDEVTHLEVYPMAQDPHTDKPRFDIMMPVSAG
ncbi:GyrI-like domain-containing protein [Paenibacillus sp. 1P07SE]|uniref:GyrI-like domain-containing protein n=1 Tax=Paenibacillus sp. 1P07SE TaxID=3132209 RepID=UPI0039A61063